jgi:hypothetical protein
MKFQKKCFSNFVWIWQFVYVLRTALIVREPVLSDNVNSAKY